MQAIALTEAALSAPDDDGPGSSVAHDTDGVGRKRRSRFDAADGDAAAASAGGALPMQVLDQIRSAKARSALEGSAPMGWAIGYPCLARDAGGQWQPATVAAVTADGHFQVSWQDAAAGMAVVHKVDCRPPDTGVRSSAALLVGAVTNKVSYMLALGT